MGLKTFTIDFAEFSQETLVRSNYKTAILGIDIKNHFQKSKNKFVRLKEYFDIISGFAFKSADYEQEGLPLIRIGDVGNDFDENNMVFLPEDYREDYERFLLKKNDIVVSLTGDGKLKSDLILVDDKYLLNQRVGSLRAKENTNILFFYYLINYYSLTKKQFYWWSNGKTQLNISPFDFLKIKIPLITKPKQDQIVAQIEPIEKKIKELKAQIRLPQEVINKVFAREFGFDLEKFEESKKEKFFEVDLSEFSKHKDLRFGIGVRKANINLKLYISKSFEYKSLGKIISLEYGSGLTDQQRIEGDYPVMGANGIVGYHNEYLIEGPSIIVGRKGSAGEINYIEENNFPIDTCFYIKFIEEQNIVYFSYLLKFLQLKRLTLFKGVPGLNRYDVYDVKIPNIPVKAQQKIVDEIKTELDKQEEIKSKIENERNKIDEIIEKAIK